MTIEDIYNYCVAKKGSEESLPFDASTIVFKVGGKMFALLPTDAEEAFVNLKCDPVDALDLRERYPCVTPGYHMNKKHWNSVYFLRGELSLFEVQALIDHSYQLIYNKLPKKIKAEVDAID